MVWACLLFVCQSACQSFTQAL